MDKATPPSSHKESKQSNSFLKYSSLGIQLISSIGIAGAIGYWIDSKMNLKFPVFLLGLILITFGGAMYKLYRDLDK